MTTPLLPGAPAPLFAAPSPVNPNFVFGSLGGRYVVLAFLPPPGPEREAAVALLRANADLFNGERAVFFGVLPDAESYAAARNAPPLHWFADLEGELRRRYRALDEAGELKPQWVVVDPSLRVLGSAPLEDGERVMAGVRRRGPPDQHAGVPLHAPVLIVPRILDPDLCRQLIGLYQADGGAPSGTMREVDGKTVGVLSDFKKRRDANVEDHALLQRLQALLVRRLFPEIEKAFMFRPTRIERFIVACYDAQSGGYFRPHRDNTTPGTAHRKFAVSINLNAQDYDGGDLRFPEFGSRTYRPPTGGACVFSCALLHEATPVTRGTRYAFLPFLYDEEGARVRAANLHTVVDPEAGAARAPETAATAVS